MLDILSIGAVAWLAVVVLVIAMCRASASADTVQPDLLIPRH